MGLVTCQEREERGSDDVDLEGARLGLKSREGQRRELSAPQMPATLTCDSPPRAL